MSLSANVVEEVAWISVADASRFESVSRGIVYRRCSPEYPTPIHWKQGPQGRLVDLRSLSPRAHKSWLNDQLRIVGERRFGPAPSIEPDTLAAPSLSERERDTVIRRIGVVKRAGGDFRLLGYRTQRDYLADLAREYGSSRATIERWCLRYRKDGLVGLVDKAPGPARSGHPSLSCWMQTWIERDWIWGKLNKAQCYESLQQRAHELDPSGRTHRVPSRATVKSFITDLGPFLHAYRHGPEAVKRALIGSYRLMGPLASVLLNWPGYGLRCNTNEIALDPTAKHEGDIP